MLENKDLETIMNSFKDSQEIDKRDVISLVVQHFASCFAKQIQLIFRVFENEDFLNKKLSEYYELKYPYLKNIKIADFKIESANLHFTDDLLGDLILPSLPLILKHLDLHIWSVESIGLKRSLLSLEGLPCGIESLSISSDCLLSLKGLPPTVSKLTISEECLDSLDIYSIQLLDQLRNDTNFEINFLKRDYELMRFFT